MDVQADLIRRLESGFSLPTLSMVAILVDFFENFGKFFVVIIHYNITVIFSICFINNGVEQTFVVLMEP